MPSPHAAHWDLDPEVVFLNHGSFGACPRIVLEHQQALRARMERQPVQFFARDLEPMLDRVRARLGSFLGADPDDLALIPNATTGVNTVLAALDLQPEDELLTTNHEYNACRNALDAATARCGARVVTVPIPFPLSGPDQVVADLSAAVTDRTRILLVDWITSPTALVLPVPEIVAAMKERGVEVLIDGAHTPGQIPVDLDRVGAAWFTGNCHKWLCTPKGAAVLHVRRDRQAALRPLTISHGANSPRTDRTRFLLEFDWTGTHDPTAALCIPAALSFLEGLLPGGIDALRSHNHDLAVAGRKLLCTAMDIDAPCPEGMLGSMAAVPLPGGADAPVPTSPLAKDPLYERLCARGFEVPVMPWPALAARLLRVSAQAYNDLDQYRALAAALATELRAA